MRRNNNYLSISIAVPWCIVEASIGRDSQNKHIIISMEKGRQRADSVEKTWRFKKKLFFNNEIIHMNSKQKNKEKKKLIKSTILAWTYSPWWVYNNTDINETYYNAIKVNTKWKSNFMNQQKNIPMNELLLLQDLLMFVAFDLSALFELLLY